MAKVKLFNEFWGEAMGRVEKSNYHPKFDNDTEKEWHETMTDEVVFRSAVLQAFDSLALKVEALEEKVRDLQDLREKEIIEESLKDKSLHYHNGMPCHNNPCIWC